MNKKLFLMMGHFLGQKINDGKFTILILNSKGVKKNE